MMNSVVESLRMRQMDNLKEAVLSLRRYAIYSAVDSSLSIPGEIDRIIKDLEEILKDNYE